MISRKVHHHQTPKDYKLSLSAIQGAQIKSIKKQTEYYFIDCLDIVKGYLQNENIKSKEYILKLTKISTDNKSHELPMFLINLLPA